MPNRKKEILSARLNKRVDIEKPVHTSDSGGGFSESWQIFASVWAEVKPLRGRENFADFKLHGTVNYRITIRYLSGIEPRMRVNYNGRIFNIRAVMNVDEADTVLELLAEEGVAT